MVLRSDENSPRDLFATPLPVAAFDFSRSVRRAARVVWRGKHLILACVLFIMVPVLLYLQQAPRLYTAEAKIMVQAPDTNDALSERNVVLGGFRLTEEVIQTEVELISSALLAQRATEKLRLDLDPEFNVKLREPSALAEMLKAINPFGGGEDEVAQQLPPESRAIMDQGRITRAFQNKLKVAAQRRSYIITIRFSSEGREKAAMIANTIAEIYVLDRLEASFNEARQVSTWLGERLTALQRDAVTTDAAVEQYRSNNNLRRISERQTTVNDQQLSEISSRLVIARSDLAQKQARLQQARLLARNHGSFETASDVLQSQLIQRLREQEAIRSREMSEALKTYGERHPRIVGLRADLNDLRGKIADEVDKIASSIANDVQIAGAGVSSLERELVDLRRQTNVAGETAVRLRDLERQAEASKSLYETFLGRFKREAEQSNMRRANARVVSPATIPLASSSPKVMVVSVIAILGGLIIGTAVVFLLESLDNTVRSSDDAEELTGLPILAMVPFQGGKVQRPLEEIAQRPRSALADGIRSLRTALVMNDGGEPGRIILVTSSVPKEGKTFVSLCLAGLFAKVDESVLLIDCDIYRPRLHSAIGLDNEIGLAQVLGGQVGFDDVVRKGVSGTLDFLPAGRDSKPNEILQGPQLEALIAQLSKRYARIIIDSPPVLAVADVRLIARLVDQVVYIVKWNSIARDVVRNGIKLLRASGIPLSGVVLSQVNQRKHAAYGYGDYGQYYGRYSEYYGKQ